MPIVRPANQEFLVSLGGQWHIARMVFGHASASALPVGYSDPSVRFGDARVTTHNFIFFAFGAIRAI
jgi:hypothetical protein